MVIIFLDVLIFDQIFLSPQVKQSVIIVKKYGIPSIGKMSKVHRTIA